MRRSEWSEPDKTRSLGSCRTSKGLLSLDGLALRTEVQSALQSVYVSMVEP